MKKILSLGLVLLLLTSCGGKKVDNVSQPGNDVKNKSSASVSASASPSTSSITPPSPTPKPLATMSESKITQKGAAGLLMSKDISGFGVVEPASELSSVVLGKLEKAYNDCLLPNAPDLVKFGAKSQLNGDRYQKNLLNGGHITIDSQVIKSSTPQADIAYLKNNTVYQKCLTEYITANVKEASGVKQLEAKFSVDSEKDGLLLCKIEVPKAGSFTGFTMFIYAYASKDFSIQYTINVMSADAKLFKENSDELDALIRKLAPEKKATLG